MIAQPLPSSTKLPVLDCNIVSFVDFGDSLVSLGCNVTGRWQAPIACICSHPYARSRAHLTTSSCARSVPYKRACWWPFKSRSLVRNVSHCSIGLLPATMSWL
eukprot:4719589-Pleurochrysis_carterae.AAC.1